MKKILSEIVSFLIVYIIFSILFRFTIFINVEKELSIALSNAFSIVLVTQINILKDINDKITDLKDYILKGDLLNDQDLRTHNS